MNQKKNTKFFDFSRIEDYNVASVKQEKHRKKEDK
jgi:hypothetical protein